MCTVSMVGDHYRDLWSPRFPDWTTPGTVRLPPDISRQEFDDLKRQVDEMAKLLRRAKIYDRENDEPDCEIDEKMELLRKVAELVGVDLSKALDGAAGPAESPKGQGV